MARLLWNCSQFLTRLADKHPLLLVLENLHLADTASLELLHFVARQIAGEIAKIQVHAGQEIASAGKAARMELKRYSAELAVSLGSKTGVSHMVLGVVYEKRELWIRASEFYEKGLAMISGLSEDDRKEFSERLKKP